MSIPFATVIVPVFNEALTLSTVIKGISGMPSTFEILVIDDGSLDDLRNVVDREKVRIIRHPYNIGNGAAIKSGIRAAKGDILVFMDGDGQHDPDDIPKLLRDMDQYDMVVGMRSFQQHTSLPRRLMNRIFNHLAAFVTGFPVKDLTSGFRAIRAETGLELLPLLPNGYSWPTTSTLVLLRSGMSVKYVPVNVLPRKHGSSRIRPVRDGIRFFMIILKICTLYSPFRIFLPVSGGMFLLGLLNYAQTYLSYGRFTNMSALMFTAALIIFMMGLISEQISQISLLRQHIRQRRIKPATGSLQDQDSIDQENQRRGKISTNVQKGAE